MDADRKALVSALGFLTQSGLSHGNSGNVSLRAPNVSNRMLISPTGMSGSNCTPEDIVVMSLDGDFGSHPRQPSSEWPMHAAIYAARPEIKAVVHCHSPWATALATTGRDIPAFHYMVAAAGGNSIRCSDYATFGTDQLSRCALKALEGRGACLLGNHGQIALGENVAAALKLAEEVEHLAMDYSRALMLGDIQLLDDEEMDRVLEKFKTYGQQQVRP